MAEALTATPKLVSLLNQLPDRLRPFALRVAQARAGLVFEKTEEKGVLLGQTADEYRTAARIAALSAAEDIVQTYITALQENTPQRLEGARTQLVLPLGDDFVLPYKQLGAE